MTSYEERMSEKYGFFSDKKNNKDSLIHEANQELELENTDDLDDNYEDSKDNNLIVPLEAWQTVLNQLGNLHEANQLMAEARERAAKAEAEAEFLREKLKNTREQLDAASKKKRFFFF
jgi:uncharacterized coiled-coil protein SlyX